MGSQARLEPDRPADRGRAPRRLPDLGGIELQPRLVSRGRRRSDRFILSVPDMDGGPTMQRSVINRLQKEALALFAEYRFGLPLFARWSEAEWRANPAAAGYCAAHQM